jgi:hypothetical protein
MRMKQFTVEAPKHKGRRQVDVMASRADRPGNAPSNFHDPAYSITQAVNDALNPDKVVMHGEVRTLDDMSDSEKEALQRKYNAPIAGQPSCDSNLLRSMPMNKLSQWEKRFVRSLGLRIRSGKALTEHQIAYAEKMRVEALARLPR